MLSSLIYAVAHLVRSPARFYLVGVHPAAGFENLGASASQLAHPLVAIPAFIGLILAANRAA